MADQRPSRRTTLNDVATEAGVSVSTVSGVLRDRDWCAVSAKTKRLVIEAAKRVGYRPNMLARSLRGESTRTIALVMPFLSQSLMADAKVQSIENAAWRHGYRLTVATHQLDRRRFEHLIDDMLAHRADGVVFWSITPDDLDLVDRVRRAGVAAVAIDPHESYDIAGVNIDRAHGGREQARHLISIGRRRIALLLTSHTGHAGQDKVRGIRKAAAEAGLDYDNLVKIEGVCKDGNYARLGMTMTKQLIDRGDDFDALIALSDNVALGAIAALLRTGRRVPHDVAVVGFDNEHAPQGQVIPLTTIHQPRNVGDPAFDALLAQLQGRTDDTPRRHVMRPQLIIRESTVPGAGHGG